MMLQRISNFVKGESKRFAGFVTAVVVAVSLGARLRRRSGSSLDSRPLRPPKMPPTLSWWQCSRRISNRP
jgi:hypothetical protein